MDTKFVDLPVLKKVYYFKDKESMQLKLDRLKNFKQSVIVLYSGFFSDLFMEVVAKIKRLDYFELDVNNCPEAEARFIIISKEVPSRYLADEQKIIAEEIGSSHFNKIMEDTVKKDNEDIIRIVKEDMRTQNIKRKYGKPWTDVELLQLWNGRAADVANKLGRTVAAVNWQRFEERKKSKDAEVPKYVSPLLQSEDRRDLNGLTKSIEVTSELMSLTKTPEGQVRGNSSMVYVNADEIKSPIMDGFSDPESSDPESSDPESGDTDPSLIIRIGENVIEINRIPKKMSIFGIEIEF